MKRLLQPLLDRRPDLAFSHQALFFVPLTHYFRAVEFGQSRWGGSFTVLPVVFPLSDSLPVRNHKIPSLVELKLYKGPRKRLFKEPWDERTSAELCDLVENVTLPLVEPLNSTREYARRPEWFTGWGPIPLTKAVIACLSQRYDEAYEHIDYGPDVLPTNVTEECRLHEDFIHRTAYLRHLIETDRSKIPQLLHDWERFSVTQAKLERYWTPTPFEFETKKRAIASTPRRSH